MCYKLLADVFAQKLQSAGTRELGAFRMIRTALIAVKAVAGRIEVVEYECFTTDVYCRVLVHLHMRNTRCEGLSRKRTIL